MEIGRMEIKKTRDSNLELLRIIAMIMIIGHHIAVHSGFDYGCELSVNRLFVQFLAEGGKIGVDLFVLVSGYYLINTNKLRTSKILKLVLECLFYSIGIELLFAILKGISVGPKELLRTLFPIITSKWWFASCYMIMYLLSPYINIFLKSLSKNMFRGYLLLLFFVWCIIPTFTTFAFYGNALTWFIFLYSCATYTRLFNDDFKRAPTYYVIIGIVLYVLTFMSAIVFDLLGCRWDIFSDHATYLFGMDKLPVLLVTLFLFLGLSKLSISSNIINVIASTTFGIYLIHDSPLVRDFLWKELFNNAYYQSSPMLIPYCLMEIAVVFAICSLIDYLRIMILEKPLFNRISSKVDEQVPTIVEKIRCFIERCVSRLL